MISPTLKKKLPKLYVFLCQAGTIRSQIRIRRRRRIRRDRNPYPDPTGSGSTTLLRNTPFLSTAASHEIINALDPRNFK